MDQEIKITVPKKDLTYCTISVLLITIGVLTGYRIGTTSASTQSAPNHPRALLTGAPLLITPPDTTLTTQTPPGTRETGTASSITAESDQSWRSKVPQELEPTATIESYRYYGTDSMDNPYAGKTGEVSSSNMIPPSGQSYVASKNGTKYYKSGCKSANRIKEENKIYFATAEEAELEGLEASTTCK